MALRESTTVDECCNKLAESLTLNVPTSEVSGSICGQDGAQREFGNRIGLVNQSPLARGIYAGTYIVPQRNPDFTYHICSGCVRYIQLAVSPTSVVKDAQGQERIKFHTFTDKKGSTFQRREDSAMWNSSIVNTGARANRKIVEYRPIGLAKLCFSQGDVFGFTIEAGSDITVLTRVFPESNRIIRNVSSTLEGISGCRQLSDIGLHKITETHSALTPLIHIITGKQYQISPFNFF